MKDFTRSFILFLLVAGSSVTALAQDADGQAGGAPITITKVEQSLVATPIYTASMGTAAPLPPVNPSTASKWLQVEFTFKVNSETKILNEAQFQTYIEIGDLQTPDDKETTKTAVLVGQTTYVNLPNGEHHGVFYIHPNTIYRYGGERAFSDFRPGKKNIRVVASIAGEQVGVKDLTEDDANWVTGERKINGFVLPKEASPWAFINIDRYPQVKMKTGESQ